jgi:hypothetical protein
MWTSRECVTSLIISESGTPGKITCWNVTRTAPFFYTKSDFINTIIDTVWFSVKYRILCLMMSYISIIECLYHDTWIMIGIIYMCIQNCHLMTKPEIPKTQLQVSYIIL